MNIRLLAALSAIAIATPALSFARESSAVGGVDRLREEARALVLVQSILSWYTRTVGEPSVQAETYKGHAALLSPASIKRVTQAAAREQDPDAQRALRFFKSYLASEYLN